MATKKTRTDKDVLSDFRRIFPEQDPWDYALREKILERNIMYLMGNQWFNENFRPLLAPNIPAPVSNICRDTVKSILSLFTSSKYRTRVYPNSEESRDMDASETGAFFLQWIDERDNKALENEKEFIILWTILAGTAFSMVDVAMDTGRFVNGSIYKGDIAIESLFPGSIRVPSFGNLLHKKEWVGVMRLKQREWVEDMYEKKIPRAQNLRLMAQEKKLLKLVADINQWAGAGLDTGEERDVDQEQFEDLVVFQEVEYRPTKKYPRGRYEAVCEGEVCAKQEKLPLPIGPEGEWFYRAQDFHYHHAPGCFWSANALDDIISPQNFINEADQAAMMNFKELGRPTLLTPFEVTLKRISEMGRSFLAVEYDDPLGSNRKPEVARGTPYPDQLLQMRSIQREMAQDASGNPKNVLAGKASHAGASGYLMDTLREVAERGHRPDIERFYRCWGLTKQRVLVLAPKVFTETRMLRIKGEGDKPIVKAFLGANLHGNTDVRMEEDAGLASTRAGQNAAISEMAKSGFFNEETMSANIRNYVLKTMGLPRPPDITNAHRKRAERENRAVREGDEAKRIPLQIDEKLMVDNRTGRPAVDEFGNPFVAQKENRDPLFFLDNHVIHMEIHDKQILTAEYSEWESARQTMLLDHRNAHKAQVDAVIQQQKMEMMEMGQAKKGGGSAPPPGLGAAGVSGMPPIEREG